MANNKSKARKLAEFLRNLTEDAKLTTEAVEQTKLVSTKEDLVLAAADPTVSTFTTSAAVTDYVSSGYLPNTHDITLTFGGDLTGSATITDMGDTSISLQVVNDSHTHNTQYYTKAQSDTSLSGKVDKINIVGATVGSSTAIPVITYNTQGQITAASTTSITVGDGAMSVTAGTGLSGGGQVGTANQTGASSVTISHADTSSVANIDTSGKTVIDALTFDGFGHVTGATSRALDFYTTGESDARYDKYVSWTASDGTNTAAVTSGETIKVVGSGATSVAFNPANQTFTVSSTDTNTETTTTLAKVGNELQYTNEVGTVQKIDLSLYLDDTNLARIISGTMNSSGVATFSRDDGTTFTVDMSVLLDDTNLSRITSAAWNTTNGVLTLTRNDSSTVTVDLDGRYLQSYTLPKATSTVRGGVELGSDTVQSVAANAVSATASRTYAVQLNSADQMVVNVPWSDTNTVYTHPTHPGDDINIDTGALTGATVISDLDFNVTTDTLGHVTDANATIATRTLTAADIGAAPSSHTHSYLPLSGGTLTGSLSAVHTMGSFVHGAINSEGRIGRADDRSTGVVTLQLGQAGRNFEIVDAGWTTVEHSFDDSGISTSVGSKRAPIFYDSNNTAYYCDPASTSKFNDIWTTDGGNNTTAPRWDTSFYVAQSQHWYAHTDSQTMYLGESGNDVLCRGQMAIGGSTISGTYGLSMNAAITMLNHDINYVSQLHFQDNVRFYDNGDDSYLNFKAGDTATGGIRFIDGDGHYRGTIGFSYSAPNDYIFIDGPTGGNVLSANYQDQYYGASAATTHTFYGTVTNENLTVMKDQIWQRLGGTARPISMSYGQGAADDVLFDSTHYLNDRTTQIGHYDEYLLTDSSADYAYASDAPFGGTVLQTSGYRAFYSGYIPVRPGDVLYGEIFQKVISGTNNRSLYYGIERFDSQKRPIAGNTGCTYFVVGGTVNTSTSWVKHQGYHTVESSHTAYNGSDGGGVYWVRIRILINYSATSNAVSQFGGWTLRRVSKTHNMYFDTTQANTYYDRNNTANYVDPAGNSVFDSLILNNTVNNAGGTDHALTIYGNNADWGVGILKTGYDYGIETNLAASHTYAYSAQRNGTRYFRVGTDYGYHDSSFRAPIWYDANDSGYYLDPNSTSQSALRMRGGTLHGPNTTWGAYLYVGTNGNVSGTATVAATNGNLHLDSAGSSYPLYLNHYSNGGVYTTTLYDKDNTAYYADLNGVTNIVSLRVNSNWSQYGAPWDGQITIRGNYPSMQFRSTNSNCMWLRHMDGSGHIQHYYAAGTDSTNWSIKHTMYTDGTWYSAGSVRSPIFYDANDTAYYTDPNSMSRMSDVRPTKITRADHHHGYLEGSYNNVGDNAAKTNPIYTIGSNYCPSATALSNMYGIGYTVANTGAIAQIGGCTGWGLYVAADGDARVFLDGSGGKVAVTGDMRSPIYYDSNNTSYYCNPNGTSSLYSATFPTAAGSTAISINSGGILDILSGTGYGFNNYIYGNASDNYVRVEGVLSNGLRISNASSGAGILLADGSVRSPIFYDSNNTGYYADPASTSVFNLMDINRARFTGGSDPAGSGLRIIGKYSSTNTWFINDTYRFTFARAHDWSQHWDIDLTAGSTNSNNGWAYIGQTQSNSSNGTWFGVAIRQFSGGANVPGDLSCGIAYCETDVRTTYVYDKNNTSYWFGPGRGSTANRNTTPYGYIDFGPMNSSYAHIYTGSPAFYFNKSLYSTGDITAYASDKRLKENCEPITNAIEKVKSLTGITYNWNNLAAEIDSDVFVKSERQVGVFAQDVQAVLPEVVKRAPFDVDEDKNSSISGEEYLTVQYEKLVPLLIEAIKEQQAQIEDLSSQLKSLKEK